MEISAKQYPGLDDPGRIRKSDKNQLHIRQSLTSSSAVSELLVEFYA
jgi:hypothetical protein